MKRGKYLPSGLRDAGALRDAAKQLFLDVG
jgi:hypothetical protein